MPKIENEYMVFARAWFAAADDAVAADQRRAASREEGQQGEDVSDGRDQAHTRSVAGIDRNIGARGRWFGDDLRRPQVRSLHWGPQAA
jgi:hypothetical protein